MPIYEYVADECQQRPACTRRKQYLQRMNDAPVTECRECGVSIRRVFSTFAAKSGAAGLSSPDPTPLNITGIPAPETLPGADSGSEGCGHDH